MSYILPSTFGLLFGCRYREVHDIAPFYSYFCRKTRPTLPLLLLLPLLC